MSADLQTFMERILGFEKRFTSYVIDPLYGQIGLTELETAVVNTKAFRRLRNIQQLGFASHIYPGATHKRYEHCIGVLHVTWTMFKQFLRNYAEQKSWAEYHILESFSDEVLECLRLAALLHDLGHGPFSHSFEQVARGMGQKIDHDEITAYLLTHDFPDEVLSDLFPDLETLKPMKESTRMNDFRKELEIIPAVTRERVVGIYKKDHKLLMSKPKGFESIRLFLNDILKGDVGSDRIDYLLRDTYFSGLGHRFNFSDLLRNLRGVYDKKSNRLLLAVDTEGRSVVEFIMITRYYHYKLIAHHSLNVLEETKFQERIKTLLNGSTGFSFFSTALDNDSIERDLPPFEEDLELAGAWNMGSIGIDHFRFFFYRIASDPQLREEYCRLIKSNIVQGVSDHTGSKIDDEDIFPAFSLENPHIPIMQIYLPDYQIEKDGEIEKYSVLLHDHSILIGGLARTYLEDSSLLVFTRKKHVESVSKFTRSTHHFYVNTELFQALMSNIHTLDKNRNDFLLYALHDITNGGRESFAGIHDLFEKVDELQKRFKTNFYDFDNKCFYDPDRGSFCYPKVVQKEQSLVDDLFLFDVAGLIEIKMHLVNRAYGPKLFHAYSYLFVPTRRHIEIGLSSPMIPLKSALRLYPSQFKDNYGLTTDVLKPT